MFCHLSLIVHTYFQSSGHGVHQLLHEVFGQLHPHLYEGVLQLLQGCYGVTIFHDGPQFLEKAEVGGISQPVQSFKNAIIF